MSLWTPSGEHPVDRTRPTPPGGGAGAPPGGGGRPPGAGGPPTGPGAPPGAGGVTPGDAVDVEELRRQLADTPAEVVVANHCYGLFELAAVYLSQTPPMLEQARLAVDALACLVDGLGERLGDPQGTLRDALAQLRLAYVQLAKAEAPGGDGAPAGDGAPGEPG